MRLDGKVAIVTGAASGIGREIAERYAEEGCSGIVIADIDKEGGKEFADMLSEQTGLEAVYVDTDVSNPDSVRDLLDETLDTFDRIDVLVNNAGISGSRDATTCHQTSLEEWNRIIDINLSGVFYGCKFVLPIFLDQPEGGSIINMGSVAGLVAFPERSAYSVSKGGVVQLTRSLAADYADKEIQANAICPGMIHTPMTDWRLSQPGKRAEVTEKIPAGHAGKPEDVASAAVFLATDESRYINGHTLIVDGGWTAV